VPVPARIPDGKGQKLLTKLGRPIVQKTAARERGKPLLVDLHPGYLVLRLKGTRHRWPISYKSVDLSAVKGAAEKRRKTTMKQRKRRR
jgi:hypothetical protein